MRKLTLLSAALALAAAAAIGWPLLAEDKDVPKAALNEIARRGDFVEQIGSGENFGASAFGDAVAVPADDSNKWFISLITLKGCSACERLRADFGKAPALAAWVDVSDHKQSWAHWQVFQIEDQTQKNRWAELRAAGVALKTFPVLILQPPVSGAFGDPKTVVMLKEGYSGNPAEIDQQLRASIDKYVRKIGPLHAQWKASQAAELAAARLERGGFEAEQQAGAAPPFYLPQALGPPNFSGPTIPPGPQPATAQELAASLPQAPPDFVLSQLASGATLENALKAWLMRQAAQTATPPATTPPATTPPPAVAPPPAATPGLPSWLAMLLTLLGTGTVGSLAMHAWGAWRTKREASGKKLPIDDATFQKLEPKLQTLIDVLVSGKLPLG